MWKAVSPFKKILGAGVCGGAAFSSTAVFLKESNTEFISNHATKFVKAEDGIQLSRKIVSPNDKLGLNLRLYQYQTCPYCSKVRAVLDYYSFSYEVVEVNPVTRSQLKFLKDYKKVPVMTSAKCETLVDSSQIISVLVSFLLLPTRKLNEVIQFYPEHEGYNQKLHKNEKIFPNRNYIMNEEKRLTNSEIQSVREEREWRDWVDDHFIHMISPNVYRTWEESLETFRYFDKVGDWKHNFPAWERYLAVYMGAAAMFAISKKLKKRHNIVDERKAILDACNDFLKAKGRDRQFLGGKEPNLADLSLYGAITSFAGTRTFAELRQQCAIGEWYDAVHKAVQEHRGAALIKAKSQIELN
ncbi:unnamed protein product [Bursaphelenchus xylophilus]|uniref:Prostaglandin E synthase 2 n=1 Tax=Bursaphelenchus xylophilus TaxID=6326 RepID=A0A1I7SD92_BURXY|nr:unnamed protein product [Bursaphelenchus xylophilus]CAG9130546.1 unnamed protein product [Bursaphelenchus xylophilus]